MDYEDTFAPVARIGSIRILLAWAVAEDLIVHQMDVKTTFLNGVLHKEVYMKQPEGAEEGNDLVCKLQRALYGLKQSSRVWYEKIDSYFCQKGFQRCQFDTSIFFKRVKGHFVVIALYVDNIIMIGNCQDMIDKCKKELNVTFDMKDLGEIHYCLGI